MAEQEWWKEAIVYQVYPKSFMDSNDDGIGDIKGITQKLPYLKTLGVDVIWLSPVYQSPMDDGGYDIADYYSVDPMFGNNQDLDDLINLAKEQKQQILMDLVINHTSDEHEWFQKALADPLSKYRDYYIFEEGFEGGPPNNWRSYFGSSAWEPVPGEENQYYLHAFTKKQPDLNWENNEVREELYKMVNFWLDKGLGGFRIDAILNIKKRVERGYFKADGEDGLAFIGDWILNQPGIEIWLNELNRRCFIPHNSMTVAEADVPDERLAEYIGKEGFFSMVFDFSYTDIDVPTTGEWFKPTGWTIGEMKANIFKNQLVTQAKGWGALYLENHDQPRSINKYLPVEHQNDHSKKMLATLFMCLRGTPFIYQGQELGMSNIQMSSMDDYDDIATHDQYRRARLAGLSEEQAFARMYERSRDNSRTPMQWSSEKQAGFSNGQVTWLNVNPNYLDINAEAQVGQVGSVFSYYQQLIALRKAGAYKELLVYGTFEPITTESETLIVYKRQYQGRGLLIVINFDQNPQTFPLETDDLQLILSNEQKVVNDKGELLLAPYGCFIFATD
ncbi:alpha-glucosidase [Vagococcus sp. BWB3-3]|uniref:Alpha-glucosidase n=1 Tax=Vagococcus allomyrinae TaxID=2794353 RepID=A0A940SWY3_9ENTE|nr:alpha-glucosidase [Vagococcus allomyrinae]MBP1042671.1 alpha-glucosidase [Vagococcus allomyrinae]